MATLLYCWRFCHFWWSTPKCDGRESLRKMRGRMMTRDGGRGKSVWDSELMMFIVLRRECRKSLMSLKNTPPPESMHGNACVCTLEFFMGWCVLATEVWVYQVADKFRVHIAATVFAWQCVCMYTRVHYTYDVYGLSECRKSPPQSMHGNVCVCTLEFYFFWCLSSAEAWV